MSSYSAAIIARNEERFKKAHAGAVTDSGTAEEGSSAGRPGHRPGARGASHGHRPDRTVARRAEACGSCGRTDARPGEPVRKTVIDLTECNRTAATRRRSPPRTATCSRRCNPLIFRKNPRKQHILLQPATIITRKNMPALNNCRKIPHYFGSGAGFVSSAQVMQMPDPGFKCSLRSVRL